MDKTGTKNNHVFVSGMFNVLHPGHFRFLKYARSLGEKLTVGVLSDTMAPVVTVGEQERMQNIKALSFIDECFILNASPESYIREHKPDIVVKGWEFHNKNNPEIAILEEYGGRLIFSSGDIKISAFSAMEEGKINPAASTISKPEGFMKRHKFNAQALQNLVTKFSALNICVIGDIIVDLYVTCQAVGMSREDPTIVVRPADTTAYLGGAGIVAAHAKGLGAQVHFISVCGRDESATFSKGKLQDYGVNASLFEDTSRPTTQKKRYRASGKTMLRVNEYSDHPISDAICRQIKEKILQLIYDLDLIIFSDFSYGMLPQTMIDDITEIARKHSIAVAADSQTSSQVGNITKFKNMSLITPTEHEARTSTKNYADGLVGLVDQTRDMTNAENVIITLAEEGLIVSGKSISGNGNIVNDRLPALQSAAIDPAGAGDALLVTTAMSLAAKGNIWESAYLGSLAAALQVSRVGNVPLTYQEIFEVISA